MHRADLYGYADGRKFIGKTTTEIFNQIARENYWLEEESVSGIGSSLVQTAEIVRLLPEVLEKFAIKTMFDAPCGDFNWMQTVNLSRVAYRGGDIVEALVERNQQKFQRDNINFVHFDLLADSFAAVDLMFCRDCLVHFSFADIDAAIANIKKSCSTFLMTTTFPEEEANYDIPTGGWRPINLQAAPFCFPEPLYMLNENCTEMAGAFRDKSLGLWRIASL